MDTSAADAPTPDTSQPALAETHSAVVYFFGDRAYKVKKPVDFGFLDFSTREKRRAVCEREVELNRRLAPDVYLGVADLVDPSDAADSEPEPLVTMVRLASDRRLSHLLDHRVDLDDDLRQLAHLLAAFHARSERTAAIDEAAGTAVLAERWAENTASLQALVRDDPRVATLEPEVIDHVQALADRYLAGRGPLFERRIAEGRACDGHGDLLADDIFILDDGPRVIDCIEFDDQMRYGDVLADVAFLAMDLEHLGRPELAELFLTYYRELADDAWPASLAHHHIAYRAHVRAKVAALRAGQGDTAAADEAHRLLGMAHEHVEAARVRLVLVGGLPGTGKSTLAGMLGEQLGATVLRSDEVRKELAGLDPSVSATAAYDQGLYTADRRDETYRTLLERAATTLAHGETVVLDASWSAEAWRDEAARVAEKAHADLVELRCTAPREMADERIRRRLTDGEGTRADPSDATPEVAAEMAALADPWPGAVEVDTSGNPEDAVEQALVTIRRCAVLTRH